MTILIKKIFELIRLRVLLKRVVLIRDENTLRCYKINIIKSFVPSSRRAVLPLDILCQNILCQMETLCEFAHIIYSTTYKIGGNDIRYIIFLQPSYIVLS